MKKPYTKNKKNDKKPDLAEGQWKPGEYKDELQLDRIERKLDELLARPYRAPALIPWNGPRQPSPWFYEPSRTPVYPYGNPVVCCSANGGTR